MTFYYGKIQLRPVLPAAFVALTGLLFAASCKGQFTESRLHWFLDMHDSHVLESQEEDFTTATDVKNDGWTRGADTSPAWGGPGSGMRVPPEGSVPRGYTPYPYAQAEIDRAGAELDNPLRLTREVLERGQERYNIYCLPCHGNTGKGNGPVVPRFPIAVPTFVQEAGQPRPATLDWSDGKIYHMITMGRGAMSSYAAQVEPRDRWAIVHYIRLLQKKGGGGAE